MSVVEQSDKSNSGNNNRALNVNNGQCTHTEDISEKRIENIPTPTFAKIAQNPRQLSNLECAKEFAKYFYSVYNNEPARLGVDEAVRASGGGSARVHVPELSLAQIKVALVRLKPKSSVGPDGIPPFLLRDCRLVLTEPCLHVYNLCLEWSHFPDAWKTTRVVPIPKSDGGKTIESYRLELVGDCIVPRTSEATKTTKISSASIKTRRVKKSQLQSVDLETVEDIGIRKIFPKKRKKKKEVLRSDSADIMRGIIEICLRFRL
ncbi:unnamed protein product [Leptosia nina]|uniref:Uncharacterized protein n=1 Tax=Leptosia nina TaxID=320188 RepID=A0AAV1JYA3_9NEOP